MFSTPLLVNLAVAAVVVVALSVLVIRRVADAIVRDVVASIRGWGDTPPQPPVEQVPEAPPDLGELLRRPWKRQPEEVECDRHYDTTAKYSSFRGYYMIQPPVTCKQCGAVTADEPHRTGLIRRCRNGHRYVISGDRQPPKLR